MSDSLKDILSGLNPDVDQETLMKYLQGKLSAQEQHEVEKKMLESDFDSDAMEGLSQLEEKGSVNDIVAALNRDLKKKTSKKNRRRLKPLSIDANLIIVSIVLLLLIVIAYVIIKVVSDN